MEYKSYQHVCRLGTEDVEGILDGTCYIMPKIDGTNGCLYLDNGEVKAGSRRKELSEHQDNQGFWRHFTKDKRIKSYLEKHPTHRLYGEFLKPHSLKTYKDNAWDKFYVFDVVEDDGTKFEYLRYEDYTPLLEEFEIDYIPLLAKIENPSQNDIEALLTKNTYLIKDGFGTGEGIVIHRPDFVNKYGRTVWAKVISEEFASTRADKSRKNIYKNLDTPIEKRIVNKYITKSVVDKEYHKIIENGNVEKKILIPRLLNTCYHVLVEEETWNIVQDYKKPVIDFKKLFDEVRAKVIESVPDLFS